MKPQGDRGKKSLPILDETMRRTRKADCHYLKNIFIAGLNRQYLETSIHVSTRERKKGGKGAHITLESPARKEGQTGIFYTERMLLRRSYSGTPTYGERRKVASTYTS